MRRRRRSRAWPTAAVIVAIVVVGVATLWVGVIDRPAVDSSAVGVGADAVGSTAVTPSVDPAQVARAEALDTALAGLAADNPGIDFAVAVADHTTGQVYQLRGDTPFVTASIVKVEILAELLLQLQLGDETLGGADERLAEAMIEESDNDAATTLWQEVGESVGMEAADVTFGLTGTTAGAKWGLTTTTAADQVTLLDAIADPAGPLGSDNSIVLGLMGSVDDDEAWGVSALARAGETVQLKNGWLPLDDDDGLWEVNSIGRITGPATDLTIAILSLGHVDLDGGIDFVERVATLARATLDPVGAGARP